MNKVAYLGIDVGSISTNLVLIAPGGEVLFELYVRGSGNPIASLQEGLERTAQCLTEDFRIDGVCTTGSGRTLVGAIVGADIVKNEITAHARAAIHVFPEIQTIFEIGGQDSKVIVVRDRAVVDFAMNLVCAAGTGSFLDSQARRLDISIEELSSKSILSTNPTSIAGRCTVFAESDMIHKQQTGQNQKDILMGLCHALVRNYLTNVCRGKELKPPIIIQGGVSANKGICRAFREAMNCDIYVPPYNMVMGAYGAALIASEAGIQKTHFRGFEVSKHVITTTNFTCGDCPNHCEVIEILDSSLVINRSGGRCRKWEGTREDREFLQNNVNRVTCNSTRICAG
jgi:predicted CoA-substrate-specific enzyme activase